VPRFRPGLMQIAKGRALLFVVPAGIRCEIRLNFESPPGLVAAPLARPFRCVGTLAWRLRPATVKFRKG
jgi:hypothetical protein